MPAITIRELEASDLDFAAAMTRAEGWATETRAEFEAFHAFAPRGGFIAERAGERIGLCVATSYGEAGFVGELIVTRAQRGSGLGRRLLDHAVEHLRAEGARSIFLDGVPGAVRLYERAGFVRICRSLRLEGSCPLGGADGVRPMRAADLPRVIALDRRAFGADRAFFLRRRFELHPRLCRVEERDGELIGFLQGRRGALSLIALGPWVRTCDLPFSTALLERPCQAAEPSQCVMGVLETETETVRALRDLGFGERREPPWRMRLGAPHPLGAGPGARAIGSAAKG